MILLASSCLFFELPSGESVPFSADMIAVEVLGDSLGKFDPEVIRHAASSVFHYFRKDLARQKVTVGEFTEALEKVLRGLGFQVQSAETEANAARNPIADLHRLAHESGDARELSFFPRLRAELRTQIRHSPGKLRFSGLRGCVKHLTGARRWSPRCQELHDQIVGYLRECLGAETRLSDCTLVVE